MFQYQHFMLQIYSLGATMLVYFGDDMLSVIPACGYTFHTSMSCIEANMAMVNYFVIHDETRRGHGWGRTIYNDWEQSLPNFVTSVYLRANSPEAERFWASLGFERRYSKAAYDTEEGVSMIKLLARD